MRSPSEAMSSDERALFRPVLSPLIRHTSTTSSLPMQMAYGGTEAIRLRFTMYGDVKLYSFQFH